jgi:hypothetical protein
MAKESVARRTNGGPVVLADVMEVRARSAFVCRCAA